MKKSIFYKSIRVFHISFDQVHTIKIFLKMIKLPLYCFLKNFFDKSFERNDESNPNSPVEPTSATFMHKWLNKEGLYNSKMIEKFTSFIIIKIKQKFGSLENLEK